MRGGWVAVRRVDGNYERIGARLGHHAGGVADVRAHEYTRVIPDDFAETPAFRGHRSFRQSQAPEALSARNKFLE